MPVSVPWLSSCRSSECAIDDLSAGEPEHVELDEVDTGRDGCPKPCERVLGCERGGPFVADHERAPVASLERDHGTGRVGR